MTSLDELIDLQNHLTLPVLRRCAYCGDPTGDALSISFADWWEDEHDKPYPEVVTERDGLCTACFDKGRNDE